MPRSSNQRLKILYLIKLLEERTDEDNGLTMPEILEGLSTYGVNAERKSIYSDLELLRSYGYEIEMTKGKKPDYRLIGRRFELAELKLLVDAVQSSYFITEKKSTQLVNKITSLASRNQAKQLKRQVHVIDRPKNLNEHVYYNVDTIHAAINLRKAITFRYFKHDIDKQRVFQNGGETYLRIPLSLCWDNDNYYLVCYSPQHDDIGHYRVDRMEKVEIEEAPIADKDNVKRFDITGHTNKAFNMFSGEPVKATLRFHQNLVNVVIDKFGPKVPFKKMNDWFEIRVEVLKGPTFFGWLFQFGDEAEIVAPDELREEMRERIEASRVRYAGG